MLQRILQTLALAVLLVGCSANQLEIEDVSENILSSDQVVSLEEDVEVFLSKRAFEKAIDGLDELIRQDRYADSAQNYYATKAYAYFEMGQPELASATAETLLKRYENSPFVD